MAWLVPFSGGSALVAYVGYQWLAHHAALLQGAPHGLHGRGFLVYLAAVGVLAACTFWEFLEGTLRIKVALVALDLAAIGVYHLALSDPQQGFISGAAVTAAWIGVFSYPALAFNVLGPLFEGRAHSLEVIDQ